MFKPEYLVKAANKRQVLDIIRKSNGVTSAEIARLSGLSQRNIVDLLYLLCNRNKIFSTVEELDGKSCMVYKNYPRVK